MGRAARANRHLSGVERQQMWARWMAGDNMAQIARTLGRSPATITHAVGFSGGFARQPASAQSVC